MTPRSTLFAALTCLLGVPACAANPPALAPAESLYARLGGPEKVAAFVGQTIDQVAANPDTNKSFDKVNLQHVKEKLIEQICSLSGGGCAYTGDPMRDVHAGHHISNAEFFALVEQMRNAMRAAGVPLAARNELLEILAPMKRDVVKL
jgi:hemoglobin